MNPFVHVTSPPVGLRRAELIATVIRADGRIEEMGVIAATDFRSSTSPFPAIVAVAATLGAILLYRCFGGLSAV